MNRVVVTGIGIVSCMGNDRETVLESLRQGISGVDWVPEMRELGFRVPIAGLIKGLDTSMIGRKSLRTMSAAARYAAVAAHEAVADAGLVRNDLGGPRVGVVVGTGAGGFNEAARAEILLARSGKPSRLGAAGPARIMNSTAAANLASHFGIHGRCYSVSSACCTGTDSIGVGFELVRDGILDVCICGAAEEMGWSLMGFYAAAFRNPARAERLLETFDSPTRACRPYDRDCVGVMVASEGAGVVVLETLDRARERGTRSYGEVLGYGSANDGAVMFAPQGEGLKRAMGQALRPVQSRGAVTIDYINPHGAGTAAGDTVETRVIREVFGNPTPLVSSTKPLNGHAQGAAGAQEAIFTLLMQHHGFVVPTANLDNLDPACDGVRHVRALLEQPLQATMSFNTGLGGSNACLVFGGADD